MIRDKEAMLRSVRDGSGFAFARDSRADAVHLWLEAFGQKRNLSTRRRNRYSGILKQFVGWMVRENRLTEDPPGTMKPLRMTERRYARRSLRSTFGTLPAREGVPPKIVMKLMRHST